ncbi:protein spaetzle 3 [Vanessa atalanta]|uniref:protein spaetzle 3 n=1 Tax=Vanessa atalanta TaxID=42275 RepID=UPI001FCDB13D|nr:protein spaetzle 3 [Vanessa atalanta]XP_047535623.1 protein spaetzle 3 [Vanessa atalanta]
MALANFTVASLNAATPALAATSSAPLRVQLDDLLYSPEEHQPEYAAQYTGNEPFIPPPNIQQPRKSKVRKRAGTAYLPPPNQFTHYPQQNNVPQNPFNSQLHTQIYQQNTRLDLQIENQRVHDINANYDNTGQYVHDPAGDYDYAQRKNGKNAGQRPPYNPGYADVPFMPATTTGPPSSRRFDGVSNQNFNIVSGPATPSTQSASRKQNEAGNKISGNSGTNGQIPPDRPRGFTKVETGGSGGKTQLHAILDYDDDDYYEDVPGSDSGQPAVTPLQGPILLRNGSVPVVPLTSYPTVNNGSFYQIPILWTALSLALGYELQGQIIRGVPCVKRNFQLYCPTAGNTYPIDKIETFIDENKALIKRMYGSFTIPGGNRVRRAPGVPDMHSGDSYFRHVRQTKPKLPDTQSVNNTGRIDACESKTEIMTPYWALNSARKLRAIVNTMHFEQAIHQEVCSKQSTSRCSGDCGCEQKYKWHRLLAYDPSDDCAGIFMDWFLFPSCCVCRCKP